MMNIYEYTYRQTIETARRILNVKNPKLQIDFSLAKTQYPATIWPFQKPCPRILFYRLWLEANKYNTRFIDDVIIHEIVHIKTGTDHNERFYKLCKKYGALYEEETWKNTLYHICVPDYIVERYGEIDTN
jgi:beta-lactamase regulating signal transducer with metallopeptidase domain